MNDMADTLSGGMGGGQWAKGSSTRCMLEILARSAARIGADWSNMVENVARVSTPYMAELLREATATPTAGHLIEEYEDENGRMIGWPAWPRTVG